MVVQQLPSWALLVHLSDFNREKKNCYCNLCSLISTADFKGDDGLVYEVVNQSL